MKTSSSLLGLLSTGILLVCSTTFAAPPSGVERPCRDDYQKFCKNVPRGGGAIARCMQEHMNELSQACQKRMSAIENKMSTVREACRSDVQQFCGNVQPGQGRILKCLNQNKDKLSTGCRSEVDRPIASR